MPQSRKNEDEEDAKIEDNNKLLARSFSTSIRTKTLISLIVLLIIFVALTFGTYYALCPQFVSKYERKTAESEVKVLIKNINSELSVLYVTNYITTIFTLLTYILA